MSNPTAVFLKCGSISFIAGLAIWLLLLQLHDEASKNIPRLDPANPGSEHSDILKELEVAVALPKPAKPNSDGPQEFDADAAAPVAQQKATILSSSPFGWGDDNSAEPLEANPPPPQPVAELPQRETPAAPAAFDIRAGPRDERVISASAEARGNLLETRIAQGSVEARIALAPEPPPTEARLRNTGLGDPVGSGPRPSPSAFVGVRPQEPQPKSYKPAGLPPSTLLPTPPLPERRPQRIAVSDEPRSIQAITQRQPPRKPGLTWNGALSFLTNLWQSPEPAGRPVSHSRACEDAAGAAPATPCSRVGTRFMRR